MAGFDNDVMYADNVDFSGGNPVTGKITSNGQLLIGSTVAPNIRVGTPTNGNNIQWTLGAGTITAAVVGPPSPTTLTNHGVVIGQGTSALVATAAGSAGQVLQSGGAGADPSYSTATYPSTAGTSGNVLTSNGTNWVSSTPTYFTSVVVQRVTATGAFTYTPTSGMKYVIVELCGGGGGSGGVAATAGQVAFSGAGGGGAYAKFLLTAAQVGASLTGSVGIAGTLGAAGNNAGGTGGNTTLATSAAWTCGGGVGGAGSGAGAGGQQQGGAAGTVTTGTGTIITTANGTQGASSGGTAATLVIGGMGGSSLLGIGGPKNMVAVGNSVGNATTGSGFGSGGSSTTAFGTNSATAGIAGTQGVAIFTEFL